MLPIFEEDSVAVDFAICLSETGKPFNLRSVNNKHSATACSGEVNSFSLNQTACVAVTLFRLLATSRTSNPPRSIFDASNPTPPLIGPAKVGNFTVWSFPHAGAVMLLMAAGLAVYGVRPQPDRLRKAAV